MLFERTNCEKYLFTYPCMEKFNFLEPKLICIGCLGRKYIDLFIYLEEEKKCILVYIFAFHIFSFVYYY